MTQQKPTTLPPKSPEQDEADKALEAARRDACEAADRLTQSSKKAARTISDPKMRAVRLPTPSHLSMPDDDRKKV